MRLLALIIAALGARIAEVRAALAFYRMLRRFRRFRRHGEFHSLTVEVGGHLDFHEDAG